MGRYVGRFAPTPSGALHIGSLVTATASFLDARAAGGIWRLRIDDLDTPRVVPGASDDILRALDGHGLHWDGAVTHQSANVDRHRAALDALQRQSLCYRCSCSRRALRGHPVYPGTCRGRHVPAAADAAVRIRVPEEEIAFHDRVQGHHAQRLAAAHQLGGGTMPHLAFDDGLQHVVIVQASDGRLVLRRVRVFFHAQEFAKALPLRWR